LTEKKPKIISLKKLAHFSYVKKVLIEFNWDSDDDIDFCVFYNTKHGSDGGVFDPLWRHNETDRGNLDTFPFIYLRENIDYGISTEVIEITNLENYNEVFFVVFSYDASIEDIPIRFDNINCNLKLSTDDGDNIEISDFNSSEQGMVYQIGRIYHENNSYMIINDGIVMSLRQAINEIPGFREITSESTE
jgi:hypothetical protein